MTWVSSQYRKMVTCHFFQLRFDQSHLNINDPISTSHLSIPPPCGEVFEVGEDPPGFLPCGSTNDSLRNLAGLDHRWRSSFEDPSRDSYPPKNQNIWSFCRAAQAGPGPFLWMGHRLDTPDLEQLWEALWDWHDPNSQIWI